MTSAVTTETTVQVLPKQLEFIESDKREVGYSGAWRAGKSRALCYKIARKAQISGNLCVLCRATLTALRETTLRVLLEPEGDLPPVLPLGSYVHNKSKHTIKLHNGGEILYFGFDRWKGVLGLTAGTIGVDEVIEIDEEKYMWLLSRLTHRADPCRQLCWATNPGSPSHFLYDRFYRNKAENRKLIHTTAFDNVFLPSDYIDYLKTLTGLYYDRYVLGKWIAFEGMVYDNWLRETHLVSRAGASWKWLLISVDEGYENPCSAGLHGVDSDNRLHRLRTFYKRHVLQADFVKMLVTYGTDIKDNHNKQLERRFVADPSAAGLIAAIEEAGLSVEGADNAVMDGIQEFRNRLAVNGDELPRYTVEPDGEGNDKFVEEIESYHYDKDEKPAKSFDHTMDEGRYAAMYMRQYAPPELFSLRLATEHKESESRKSELDISTGLKRDIMRERAIAQGHVPDTCRLPGAMVMALIISDRDPCVDCEYAEKCAAVKRQAGERREAILSREGAWNG